MIDGHPARRTTNCGDKTDALSAFVAVGNRMFVFAVSDATQLELFDAYLSTIKLPRVRRPQRPERHARRRGTPPRPQAPRSSEARFGIPVRSIVI